MKLLGKLGARGVLALLGGMATVAATTCGAYGMPSCRDDRDCRNAYDDWYCDQAMGICSFKAKPDTGVMPPDSGAPASDAGE